jgi:hypothetical protein
MAPSISWSAALALGAALTLPGSPLGAQRGKAAAPPLRPFLGSLEEARRRAAERNVPLLIHIVLEGEPQNDEYRDRILPDAALRKLSERAVVIVSNNGEHGRTKVEETVDGRTLTRSACSVYPFFEDCNGHRQTWDPLYFEYHEPNGDMKCPQTVLLSPSGELAWRFNVSDPPPTGEVVNALQKAQKAAGPGLTNEELSRVKQLLTLARKAALEGDPAAAWRNWQAIAELLPSGLYGEEAKQGAQAAVTAMGAAVDAAEADLVPGKAAQGYARLLELDRTLAGTPLHKRVKEGLRKAERDKALQEEIAAYKLELEAQALLDEGLAELAGGDERKAERALR